MPNTTMKNPIYFLVISLILACGQRTPVSESNLKSQVPDDWVSNHWDFNENGEPILPITPGNSGEISDDNIIDEEDDENENTNENEPLNPSTTNHPHPEYRCPSCDKSWTSRPVTEDDYSDNMGDDIAKGIETSWNDGVHDLKTKLLEPMLDFFGNSSEKIGSGLESALTKVFGKNIFKSKSSVEQALRRQEEEIRRQKEVEIRRQIDDVLQSHEISLRSELDKKILQLQSEVANLEKALENEESILNQSIDLSDIESTVEQALVESGKSHNSALDEIIKEVASYPIPKIEQPKSRWKTPTTTPEGQRLLEVAAYRDFTVKHSETNQEHRHRVSALIEVADVSLNLADEEFSQGNFETGSLAVGIAVTALDLAISFTPGIGFAKDVYEAIVGVNPITGDKLSTFERSIAVIGIVTIGIIPIAKAIGVVGKIMKRSAKTDDAAEAATKTLSETEKLYHSAKSLGVKTPKGMQVFAKIYGAINSLPGALKIQRIREGADASKVAIVGRSMGNAEEGLVGVRDVALHLNSKGITPSTFEPSPGANRKWQEIVEQYRKDVGNPNAYLPEDIVKTTDLYKENVSWANRLKEESYTVLDIGNPNNISSTSIFYEMEKSILF